MPELIIHASELAHWHALVNDAERRAVNQLDEDSESHLVYLLMRFCKRPDIANSILALEFLESLHARGEARFQQLQELGDKCLLFSGLFPDIAKRRQVSLSYFIDMGQSAYALISDYRATQDDLYQHLSTTFAAMIDVLSALRKVNDPIFESSLKHYHLESN